MLKIGLFFLQCLIALGINGAAQPIPFVGCHAFGDYPFDIARTKRLRELSRNSRHTMMIKGTSKAFLTSQDRVVMPSQRSGWMWSR